MPTNVMPSLQTVFNSKYLLKNIFNHQQQKMISQLSSLKFFIKIKITEYQRLLHVKLQVSTISSFAYIYFEKVSVHKNYKDAYIDETSLIQLKPYEPILNTFLSPFIILSQILNLRCILNTF